MSTAAPSAATWAVVRRPRGTTATSSASATAATVTATCSGSRPGFCPQTLNGDSRPAW
jgi:hypothetical protein